MDQSINIPRILGLGGIFIKVADPEAYQKWWADHMGMDFSEWGSKEWPSDGQAYTVFSPFKDDTEYFSPSGANFMVNLRVNDVSAMLDRAVAGGAKRVGDILEEDYGTFGWFIDPVGIKIELWKPGA
ncbi:VOC family protein [Robiginitomaculum antarcticum]|uniref:VOC family protein n=1 Tax=Robiginitomaculum antarcticum TaxID=437507 RepID=UPI0003784650|nr:VOC family protein [Robiginitomaculum antarcticum]